MKKQQMHFNKTAQVISDLGVAWSKAPQAYTMGRQEVREDDLIDLGEAIERSLTSEAKPSQEAKLLRMLTPGEWMSAWLMDDLEYLQGYLASYIKNQPPDGHFKFPHLWPVKLLHAGRADYEASAVTAMRAAASLRR